jgi:ElaB/YqjD/DUF883 family membrane-anchored ribosome-binding protein
MLSRPLSEEKTMTDMNVGAARQQLVEDFNKIVADSEGLLRAMASVPGEKAIAMRASVEANLDSAKARLRDLQGMAAERTGAAVRATDEYAHENPWPLIGAAAAVGFILGVIVSSGRD